MLDASVDKSFKDFKDLTYLSMSPNCTGTCVKQLQSGCSNLDEFTRVTHESEESTVRLTPPSTSPPGKPLSPDRKPSRKVDSPPGPAAPSQSKNVFRRLPSYCLSPPCKKADHTTRLCDLSCALPSCLSPGLAHKARTCLLTHDAP